MAGRFFAPIAFPEFFAKFEAMVGNEGISAIKAEIGKDLKVEFDNENFSSSPTAFGPKPIMGHRSFNNGLTFWGCCAGGDWESPVFFIVYWDGKKLRGYVPTDGNPWNTDTKQAYGNDEDADSRHIKKRFAGAHCIEDLEFDSALILADIQARILPKPLTKVLNKPNKAVPKALPSLQERIEALTFYGAGDEAGELFQEACSFCYHLFGLGKVEQAKIVCMWAEEMARCSYVDNNADDGVCDNLQGAWG